jgi:hypothetical protein
MQKSARSNQQTKSVSTRQLPNGDSERLEPAMIQKPVQRDPDYSDGTGAWHS